MNILKLKLRILNKEYFKNYIYLLLFLAVLGLCCCAGFFSFCRDQGLLSSCDARASHCGFSCCRTEGCAGFSSCSSWAWEHKAEQLQCMEFVAPWHVECSQIRDWTRVFCIVKWILHHWATREAPWGPLLAPPPCIKKKTSFIRNC